MTAELDLYRERMLAPDLLRLGIEALTPPLNSERDDYFAAVCQAGLDLSMAPYPPDPPAPLLRWTCRPPDADPAWTVADLRAAYFERRRAPFRGWYPLGLAYYHPITGRSSIGRATFHGRLWDPPAQSWAWLQWRDACDAPARERARLGAEIRREHRAIIADAVEHLYPIWREKRSGRLLRVARFYSDEHLAAAEAAITRRVLERSTWFNLTAYRDGQDSLYGPSFTEWAEPAKP